jgi:hypothetical protein
MNIHRLSWKGVLFSSEALLYAAPDTPQFLLMPILIFLYLPKLFLSYLRISDSGIELFYWPNYRQKTSWENIERLGEVFYLEKFTQQALYLRSESGEKVDIKREKGLREKLIIPLSDFRGWPTGTLYDELQKHIPHILREVN